LPPLEPEGHVAGTCVGHGAGGASRGRPWPSSSNAQGCPSWASLLSSPTAVLQKVPHSNSCKRVPNRPLRPRRGRFGTLLQQLECGIFGRTAVFPSLGAPHPWVGCRGAWRWRRLDPPRAAAAAAAAANGGGVWARPGRQRPPVPHGGGGARGVWGRRGRVGALPAAVRCRQPRARAGAAAEGRPVAIVGVEKKTSRRRARAAVGSSHPLTAVPPTERRGVKAPRLLGWGVGTPRLAAAGAREQRQSGAADGASCCRALPSCAASALGPKLQDRPQTAAISWRKMQVQVCIIFPTKKSQSVVCCAM